MPLESDLLLVIKSSGIGDGEPDLGETLMKSFLSMLWESQSLPARIICMNSGIFLSTQGSPVEEILRNFEKAGSEIFSCTTCLEYYGRKEKLVVGKPGTMRDTVAAMLAFKKILTP